MQTNNLDSEIQLIDSVGEVLAKTNSSVTLRYSFNPFTVTDVGQYSCTAGVTSPDFPGSKPLISSQNFTLELLPSKNVIVVYTRDKFQFYIKDIYRMGI